MRKVDGNDNKDDEGKDEKDDDVRENKSEDKEGEVEGRKKKAAYEDTPGVKKRKLQREQW